MTPRTFFTRERVHASAFSYTSMGRVPAVIHLPLRETLDWWVWIGSRYLATLPMSLPYFIKGLIFPGLKKVSDKEFEDLLNYSMMSKFLTNKFDDKDKEIFKGYLSEDLDWYMSI